MIDDTARQSYRGFSPCGLGARKNLKPLSDGEVIQDCLNEVAEALFEGKERQVISERSEIFSCPKLLADDLLKQLSNDISAFHWYWMSPQRTQTKPSYASLSDISAR